MSFSAFHLVILAFAVALVGVSGGLWMEGLPRAARIVVPFSGGLLTGVALFGLWPELAAEIGWRRGLPVFVAGFFFLLWIDRKLHDHNHSDCAGGLHGFILPLLIAAAMHAFLDGWGVAASDLGHSATVRLTFPLAVLLHKAPEGLALGAIVRASTRSRAAAFGWCALAESATLAGGWAGQYLTPRLGSAWTNYPLAIAGGCFLYLGYHAIDGDWRRFGPRTAFAPALTGFAGAAFVQSSVRWFAQ